MAGAPVAPGWMLRLQTVCQGKAGFTAERQMGRADANYSPAGRGKMQVLIILFVFMAGILPGAGLAFYLGPLTDTQPSIHYAQTDTDLIHGRMLVIGKYLYHGTFDRKAWLDDDYQCAAKLYKRDADTLDIVSTAVFPSDPIHRNIADIQYSPSQHRLYVLFMGGLLASVDPDSLGWTDINQPEDLRKNEMGKVIISPWRIYRISQTYPQTIVTQYNAENGVEMRRITLDVPAGHGGLYAHGLLYVTTSQNDGNGSMIYILHPETLEIVSRHQIAGCENIAPDFDTITNHDGRRFLVFGCEGHNQDKTLINNLYLADAYNPSFHWQYSTNTTVQGGIWGVTVSDQRVYVSRGSNPGTIEIIDPWAQRSVFRELPPSGCNGGVDVVGSRIYWKAYQQFHNTDNAVIGWIE